MATGFGDAAAADTGVLVPSEGGAEIAVTLRFRSQVGDAPFDCGAVFANVGTTGARLSPLDFRVYVHDVRLVDEQGVEVPVALEQDDTWQYRETALLDFEDKSGTCASGTTETHVVLTGHTRKGSYRGLRFRVGVPFDLNHGDAATAPSPLNLSGLFWSWADGYKFARMDARITSATTNVMSGFLMHLGSTGCSADSRGGIVTCTHPNVGEVSLSGFDPLTQPVIADYGALFGAAALDRNTGGAPGCMSEPGDPECAALLPNFGIDITTGGPHAASQTLFRHE